MLLLDIIQISFVTPEIKHFQSRRYLTKGKLKDLFQTVNMSNLKGEKDAKITEVKKVKAKKKQ